MIKKLEQLIKEAPKTYPVAFWSTMILGLFAHYYAIANKITNHDDLRETCAELYQERWGRWFLAYSSDLTGNSSMPFDCLLGLVFIAVSAVLIVGMLEINSTIISALIGGFLGTFPTITFNNLFTGTADCYPMSILFMVIAAYIAIKAKKLWAAIVFPIILMVFSLGIYQAYLGVAMGLMILSGIIAILYEKANYKEILFKEIRYLVTSVAGIGCYLITSKVICKITGIEMDSYQNMDKMGTIDMALFPSQIKHSFTKSIGYYLWNVRGVHYKWLSVAMAIVILATIAMIVVRIVKEKLGKLEIILLVALLVALPMAAGFIYLEGANNIHLLIVYGFVVLPLLPFAVMDKVASEEKLVVKIFEGVSIFVFSALIFNYITLANMVYMVDYYTYEESYSYAQTVATVIRTTPGYSIDSKIYMIGLPASNACAVDEFYQDDPRLTDFDNIGLDRDFNVEYSKNCFYWYFLGLTNVIDQIDMEDAKEMGAGDIEVFPSEDSVREIDGDIVIRFE